MAKAKTPRLSEVDRVAMTRAIEIRRRESFVSREQIDDKLATEDWEEVGKFASYGAQCSALKLKPWQWPPCWIRNLESCLRVPPGDHGGQRAAAELLKRLLDAGLSRYEPDPLGALAAIEARAG
jgi:hypothetical protein